MKGSPVRVRASASANTLQTGWISLGQPRCEVARGNRRGNNSSPTRHAASGTGTPLLPRREWGRFDGPSPPSSSPPRPTNSTERLIRLDSVSGIPHGTQATTQARDQSANGPDAAGEVGGRAPPSGIAAVVPTPGPYWPCESELCSPRLLTSRALRWRVGGLWAFGRGSGQQGQSNQCTPLPDNPLVR